MFDQNISFLHKKSKRLILIQQLIDKFKASYKDQPNIIIGASMKKPGVQGFSTLTEMYSAWIEFGVPASFYHYFLTLLKNKTKPDQTLMMNKQISTLRSGTHLYLKIKSSIEARQHSLEIISSTLPLLKDQETLSKPLLSSSEQRQFLGYKKLFQSKQNPQQRGENRQLRQLANHLVIYRKVTLQIIFLIHKWIAELMSLGFEGMIQFLYNNQDYLEDITDKTAPILNEYQDIFEFNPFFILRKEKISSQHVLVKDYLNISPQYAKNLYEGLNLLAQHHSNLLRTKILGQKNLMPSQRKLEKSQSVDKVYGSLLNGNEYHMIKNSYLKSDKPFSKENPKTENSKILKNKSEVRILPSLEETPVLAKGRKDLKTNFIQRKYPVFFSDNTENEWARRNKKNNLADYILQKRYSISDDMIKSKKNIISNEQFSGIEIVNKSTNNNQQNIFQMNGSKISRNQLRSKDMKTRFQQNFPEQQKSRNLALSTNDPSQTNVQSPINIDMDLNKSNQMSISSQQDQLQFKIEKNIYPTNVLRYLREVFRKEIQNQGNTNRMTTQKIQKLAKALLAQRQHITIYKIFQKPLKFKPSIQKKPIVECPIFTAWMVCKLYKDSSTLQKTVDIVFLYQFHKFPNIQNSIISYFEEFGYLNIKQNGTIVHQSNPRDHLQLQGSQVVRCKYKISPSASDEDIKDIVKSNVPLKMSRILKYHYYSKTSKYHKYCDHRSKEGACSINYQFQHISKVFINNKPHIKVKIDTISRIKECYKIYHHLNKKTFLIVATSIEDLKKMEKNLLKEHEQEMDQDQSFDSGKQPNICQYNWVCFEQGKVMRKFVDQRNKPVINQFVWIENNVPQVKSIALDKKDIAASDCLVLSQPYFLAIYGKDDQQGLKSLAVLDFSQ